MENIQKTERFRNYELERSNFAKRQIIEYGLNNKFNYFFTLTTDAKKIDRDNPELINDKIRKFFNNFKERYDSELRYLFVPELHKDGRVHFHGLIYTTQKDFFEFLFLDKKNKLPVYRHKWFFDNLGANRFVYISENSPYCIYYMVKYITKSMDFPFKHRYYCSKGLKKSDVICNPVGNNFAALYFYRKLLETGQLPSFTNIFVEKYKLSYAEYDLLFGKNPYQNWVYKNIIVDDDTFLSFTKQMTFLSSKPSSCSKVKPPLSDFRSKNLFAF